MSTNTMTTLVRPLDILQGAKQIIRGQREENGDVTEAIRSE